MWPRLALLVALLPAVAAARPWQGLEVGKATKADVTAKLGEPSKVTEVKSREVWAFSGDRAPSGTLQAQFHFAPKLDVLERIVLFPKQQIERVTIEATYGAACTATRGKPPCFVAKLSDDTHSYLVYSALGMTIFLSEDGSAVQSIVYAARAGRSVPTPATPTAAREERSAAAGVDGPASGAAADAGVPANDEWSVAGFEEVAAPQNAAPKPLEVSANISVHEFIAFDPVPGKVPGRTDFDARLTVRGEAGYARARATLVGRVDLQDPSRNRLDFDEVWLSAERWGFKITGGRALVSWGRATLYNPTDVINPYDLTDLVIPEKRGTWMLHAEAIFGPVKLELIGLPMFESNPLPRIESISDEGELISRSAWVTGSIRQPSEFPLHYRVVPGSVPISLSSAQAAARLSVTLLGIDASASYAYLYDKFPVARAGVTLDDPPVSATVGITLDYRRLHVGTLDFERTFGPLRIAGEAALFSVARPTELDLDRTWLAWVGGADLQLGPFADDYRVHLFAELTDTVALKGELLNDLIGQLHYPFGRAILGRAQLSNQTWRLELTGVVALKDGDWLLFPAFELNLGEALKARIGATLLGGPATSFFGQFRRNSRAELSLKGAF
jgi:hypothetical protein